MPTETSHDLESAFAHCAAITRHHYENFPVASWLLPRRLRPHVHSIYAFARTADDFADEPGMTSDERLAKLADWQDRLENCLQEPRGPVFTALGETIRTHSIPLDLFRDLLTAFTQDVKQSRHESFEDLLAYSSRSANPVGRLVLHLFGYTAPDQLEQSDAICTALQLTNFWQDIHIDYSRDRVYLPQTMMRDHGVPESDLATARVTAGFRALLTDLIGRTRALFEAGRTLPESVAGRLRYELRTTWLGGSWILDSIERVDYDVFERRPKLSKASGLGLLLRSCRPVGGPR